MGHSRRIEEFVAAMKLALAGMNHRTAPVQVREKLAFRMEDVPAALLAYAGPRRKGSPHPVDM